MQKFKLTVLAAALAVAGNVWADTKSAEKWIDSEFKPSTLSRTWPPSN